jgi:adenine-specific DNA-methyltransferase
LNDLLRQIRMENPSLADDLQREYDALADRRSFGLNFERHVPEAVELPGRKVRKGDKVRVLPPRGESASAENQRLWRVVSISTEDGVRRASLTSLDDLEDGASVMVDDLVVVAEFRDPIYPGLVSKGKVERGGDKPFHAVINAENFHALQTLLFTHRGKVDAIYIDPPYNTGAKDWKYNNDYVEGDDLYRHSKWLAFMERRLTLARELLHPDDSVLIVTIDEKEHLRLGLLLEQVFPTARIQMVSTVINPKGAVRANEFSRTDEYIFFVMLGSSGPVPVAEATSGKGAEEVHWQPLRRSDITSKRGTAKGGPAQFYPIYVDLVSGVIRSIGDALPHGVDKSTVPSLDGCETVFPLRPDGTEMNWGLTAPSLRRLLDNGYVRAGNRNDSKPQRYGVSYLTSGRIADIAEGRASVAGRAPDGSVIAHYVDGESKGKMPETNWREQSHNAQHYGTLLLKSLLPGRSFPFPKSLYAVEDTLNLFVAKKQQAVVLDFFAGSGTTAHAVMRLNRRDGGSRQALLITNNEVAADEHRELRQSGLRPGDGEWERFGICDYVTIPRLKAAVTGTTLTGESIVGEYKFNDVSPMAEGFEENFEFFNLTYEAPLRVASNREFITIAPLLWLRAGLRGRRIEDVSAGWDVADVYGVISDLDQAEPFLKAIAANENVGMAFIVTDEDRLFEALVAELPDHVEPVRLYEAYLRNFEIEAGRSAR